MRSKIHVSCLCVFLLIILLYFSPESFLPLVLAVTIHELGHILAAKLCGIDLGELKLGILGAAIIPQNTLFSYKKELILCIGGPAANIFSALAASPLKNSAPFFNQFWIYSISLAALNLMPIKTFDGGRIFSSLLLYKLPVKTAEKILNAISFIFIFTLWSISVYLLLKISSSISLFVFSLSIFSKIFISAT